MNNKYIDGNGDYHWLLQGEPLEDWTLVEEEVDLLPDPNYVPPYDVLRMHNYPLVTNQLDMLWHELNQSGSVSTNGEWFNQIKSIKEEFPKP